MKKQKFWERRYSHEQMSFRVFVCLCLVQSLVFALSAPSVITVFAVVRAYPGAVFSVSWASEGQFAFVFVACVDATLKTRYGLLGPSQTSLPHRVPDHQNRHKPDPGPDPELKRQQKNIHTRLLVLTSPHPSFQFLDVGLILCFFVWGCVYFLSRLLSPSDDVPIT